MEKTTATDITSLHPGTTFESKEGYLVTVDEIWVDSVHMSSPSVFVRYSFTPLVKKEGMVSGSESNRLQHFIEHILKGHK